MTTIDPITAISSDRKIEANRRNAALSTGPVSPEGKAASSRNAISHGLTSCDYNNPVLPGESPEEFVELLDSLRAQFLDAAAYYLPEDSLDRDAAKEAAIQELAATQWRLRRIPALEAGLISIEIAAIRRQLSEAAANANKDHQQDQDQDPNSLHTLACAQHAALITRQLNALAFARLVERRVITNLYAQEARLSRRAQKLILQLTAGSIPTAPANPAPRPPAPTIPIRKNEPTANRPQPPAAPIPFVHATPKVGRNEPCPCNSGLKFKRCCGNPATTTATAAAASC